jgi:hypothetical protein
MDIDRIGSRDRDIRDVLGAAGTDAAITGLSRCAMK